MTEDPSGLDYDTSYTYDVLDNLLTVSQGSQDRTFEYSSLGRLLSADNPETGDTTYTYNDDGTLASKTDARDITIDYTYDALDRITEKDYSDSTPDVTYSYYTSGTNSVGQPESVSTSAATETFNSYDALGRVTAHTQEIVNNSNDYTMSYTYLLNDAIETMTYPSGRQVDYTPDDAGRIRTVDDGTTTFADLDNALGDYDPRGRIARIELGNGLWETRDFRPAGTATELKLGTSSGGSERLKLAYNYDGTDNNGNLASHVITQAGSTTYTQTFTYDGVNRLATMTETDGFVRDYDYDQYGNRWLNSTNTTGPATYDPHEPTASSNFPNGDNRLSVASSTYDAAGNQTFFTPYTLTYDAENRITEAESASNGNAYYAYDGNGRRVGKAWTPGGGSQTLTYYIYDITGRLAAEYSDEEPEEDETSYVFADLLGSVRMVTDGSGNVNECYDFLPFGRMLTGSDHSRSSVGCYPSSPTSYSSDLSEKFTGHQRDEIQLDYFQARYLSAAQGRFTLPDPLLTAGRPAEPQSWNKYAYVLNNPLQYTDPTGLFECVAEMNEEDCKKLSTALTNALNAVGVEYARRLRDPVSLKRVRRVLDVMGKRDTPNGVEVQYGTCPKGAPACTLPLVGGSEENPEFVGARITFDPAQIRSNELLSIDGFHEGTHAADYMDSRFDLQHPLTTTQLEYRAYQSSVWAAQALNKGSLSFEGLPDIWQSGWQAIDIHNALIGFLPAVGYPLPDDTSPDVLNPWKD